MKKIILFIFCIGLMTNTFSQKPDKDKMAYYYISLPKTPLPSEFQSYKIEITADDLNFRDIIYSNIRLDGFKKMELESAETPDLTIKVEMYPFEFSNPEKTSNTTTTKVDGVEKKSTTYGYKGQMKYKFKVYMVGKDQTTYFKSDYASTVEISSSGYKNYTEAGNAYKANAEGKRATTTQEIFSRYVTGHLNEMFGFPKGSIYVEMFSIKIGRKCKHDYSDLISAYELFVKSFEIVKKDPDDNATFFESIQPAIVKWEAALQESNVEDKKSRINEDVTCMIYNNIGVAYLLAKEYEKAIVNFDKCIEIDRKWGNVAYFRREAVQLTKMIENYNEQRALVN